MSSNDHHALADCKPVLVEKTEHTRETTPLKSPEDTKIKVLSINEDLEQKEQKAAGAEHKNRGFDQGKVQLDKQKWMARGLAMSKEHDEKTDETQTDQTKHNTSHEIPQEDRTKVGVQSQAGEKPSEALKPSRVGGGHLSSIDSDYGLLHKAGSGKSDPSTASKIAGAFGVNPK